jgi:hypothetical protein
MTAESKPAIPWPWANRPRDYKRDTMDLSFEEIGFRRGPLPRLIRVTDPRGRACLYRAVSMTILEPVTERMCLSYTTHEHSWDQMPQVLVARDAWGNFCTYVPVDPREAKADRLKVS